MRNYFDKLSKSVEDVFGENIEIEVLDQNEELEYIKQNG